MSPQQDVSVRHLLAVGPAVSAICTPPEDGADEPADEPAGTAPSDGEPGGPAERPGHHQAADQSRQRPQGQGRHQVERFGTACR
jgi:hypothetical protein